MKADRLITWMRRHPEKVATYTLAYGELDAGEEMLGEWDSEPAGNARAELATSIVEAAQHHCDEMGSSCKYHVRGVDDEGKKVLQTVMRQQPDSDFAIDGLKNTDDASASGVTAQAIRHTEYMTQMMVRGMGQIMKVQADQVEQLQRTVAMMQKREDGILDLARTMSTQTEDAEGKQRNHDRYDKLADVVMGKLVPAIGKEMGLLPADFDAPAKVLEIAKAAGDGTPPTGSTGD